MNKKYDAKLTKAVAKIDKSFRAFVLTVVEMADSPCEAVAIVTKAVHCMMHDFIGALEKSVKESKRKGGAK